MACKTDNYHNKENIFPLGVSTPHSSNTAVNHSARRQHNTRKHLSRQTSINKCSVVPESKHQKGWSYPRWQRNFYSNNFGSLTLRYYMLCFTRPNIIQDDARKLRGRISLYLDMIKLTVLLMFSANFSKIWIAIPTNTYKYKNPNIN